MASRDKEGQCIMIKGSRQKEYKTILNIDALSTGTLKYIKQTLMDIKREMDSNTLITGDFNTPFSRMDRSFGQMSQKTLALKSSLSSSLDVSGYHVISLVSFKVAPLSFFNLSWFFGFLFH